MKQRLHPIELTLMIVAALALTSGAVALHTQSQLAEKVVRLHVLANSDSEEDQALKLKVRDAVLDESTPKDLSNAPSLILRCVGRQESAWEVAKRYNTTIADILAANQLEQESEIPYERLLLIPKKRA